MKVVGIVFANLHERNIPELTADRTVGSIPFGCRYRLIDFTLSNMVNSGITDIRVATQYNYQSLMDHIGSGKNWDLARHSGGIKVLPPDKQGSPGHGASRLETLKSIRDSLSSIKADYLIMADCDGICNIDYSAILQDHIDHHADITMMVKRSPLTGTLGNRITLVESDENGNITGLARQPGNRSEEYDIFMNVAVISGQYLRLILQEAFSRDYHSLTMDIMMKQIGNYVYRVFRYDGTFAFINSLQDYFSYSMKLLADGSFRHALFGIPERPILTKVHNSPPTRYLEGATVRNSLVADGCCIEGVVENSVLFRGVHIGKNAVVKNSILFQNDRVGPGCSLNYLIADKNAVLQEGCVLSGHPLKPFFIAKSEVL